MATTPTGLTVPAGTDVFDPDGDMRDLAGSFEGRIIVPVANTTERGTVAAAVSPSPSEPLFTYRADARQGFELEVTTNGATWTAVNRVMRDPTLQEFVQGGTLVITTAANGTFTLSYPTPFTVSVRSLVVSIADTTAAAGFVRVNAFTGTGLTGQQCQAYTTAGAVIVSSGIRVNWMAVGY